MPIRPGMTFNNMPVPAKALATCIILTLGIGMIGALGQIIVHDIFPTFYGDASPMAAEMAAGQQDAGAAEGDAPASVGERGDLFEDLHAAAPQPDTGRWFEKDQFVWTLKWTHIHLFGINMIFILLGGLTLFLDIGSRARTWLIVLPFVGVLVDILAVWLRGFVSPAFFWLHIPGGGIFAVVFAYVSLRALWEMWGPSTHR